MALHGEAGGVGVVHRVVAGEHVPVGAVLDRVFADEAGEVGGVPALGLQLQAGGGVGDAASQTKAVTSAARFDSTFYDTRYARIANRAYGLGVVERLVDERMRKAKLILGHLLERLFQDSHIADSLSVINSTQPFII